MKKSFIYKTSLLDYLISQTDSESYQYIFFLSGVIHQPRRHYAYKTFS